MCGGACRAWVRVVGSVFEPNQIQCSHVPGGILCSLPKHSKKKANHHHHHHHHTELAKASTSPVLLALPHINQSQNSYVFRPFRRHRLFFSCQLAFILHFPNSADKPKQSLHGTLDTRKLFNNKTKTKKCHPHHLAWKRSSHSPQSSYFTRKSFPLFSRLVVRQLVSPSAPISFFFLYMEKIVAPVVVALQMSYQSTAFLLHITHFVWWWWWWWWWEKRKKEET